MAALAWLDSRDRFCGRSDQRYQDRPWAAATEYQSIRAIFLVSRDGMKHTKQQVVLKAGTD